VLKANPRNAQAHIEMARFYIMTGHINYRNFQPGSLEKAAWSWTTHARRSDSAEVDVLLGHVYYLRGKPREAVKSREGRGQARKALAASEHGGCAHGPESVGRRGIPVAQGRSAVCRHGQPADACRICASREAFECVFAPGKLEEADNNIRLRSAHSGNAAGYINYAEFLLFRRGLPTPPCRAPEAVAISDSGMGDLILRRRTMRVGAIETQSAGPRRREYLALARGRLGFLLDDAMAAQSVDTGPAIQTMVRNHGLWGFDQHLGMKWRYRLTLAPVGET